MNKPFILLSAILACTCVSACLSAAVLPDQEPLPAIRILPDDVDPASIKQFRSPAATNLFTVSWTYTHAGAKKMLAFRQAHAGQKVLEQVGEFEFHPTISTARPPNWTETGWLKRPTDKFYAVSAADAEKIVSGLRGK